MKKTNREKNLEHDARASAKVRPKQPDYNWQPLDLVIRQWIQRSQENRE
jgi:hypothetical protein